MRANIIFFIAAYFTVLLLRFDIVSNDVLPTLSCKEALATRLVRIYRCSKSEDYFVVCERVFHNHVADNKTLEARMEFYIQKEADDPKYKNDTDNIALCIVLSSFSGKLSSKTEKKTEIEYRLSFYNELSSGISIVDRDCWSSIGEDCIHEVWVREDIIALSPIMQTPDTPDFWNFSSPLFRPGLPWLFGLYVKGFFNKTYPFVLPGLKGCGIRLININGYFGSDRNGPIPALEQLPSLQFLNISNNKMAEHVLDTLNGSEAIDYIILEQNQVHQIPTSVPLVKNITHLFITSNMRDIQLDTQRLRGLNNLQELDFSGTGIKNWPVRFPSLPALTILSLSRCGIKTLDSVVLQFPALRELRLSGNFLVSLPGSAFGANPKLFSLYLNNNSLSLISDDVFTRLSFLSEIDLSNNRLNKWPIIRKSKGISYKINLSKNRLTTIVNLGQHGVRLHKLDISQNHISHWDDPNVFMMSKRRKITVLQESESNHFQENYGSNVSGAAVILDDENSILIPWVEEVNISRNHIRTFSAEMLDSMNVLQIVDLGGNDIDCSGCDTSLLQNWLGNTSATVNALGAMNAITCVSPDNLKGQPLGTIQFDKMCMVPRRRFWWWLGSLLGVLASSFLVLGLLSYYYRTEVMYLIHLAKVRAISRRKHQDESGYTYDAFICYSGRNRKWVRRRLACLLERPRERYRLCCFDRDFRLGTRIFANIVDAIDHSRKVVVVLTDNFVQSKWCQWELEMANHKMFSEDREFLVLLQLEALERRRLPRLLRFLLDTRPVVQWPRPETASAVKAAAKELRRVLGPSLWQSSLLQRTTQSEEEQMMPLPSADTAARF